MQFCNRLADERAIGNKSLHQRQLAVGRYKLSFSYYFNDITPNGQTEF
ncbi:hypothetical protein Niako_3847 [Niastella koreensis GR20-10]|uniref:Uncharacterized protein n=1 Tax=Niastella koreensis (strain DSM 17620 / KACC 11465 / NBRC 106392 / GR20-10) TaxID=700598 RepID=G8T8G9_NIAKG|nr:hypothetical protein Niako_3847 [Niastella koreensis GR20-10]